MTWEERWHPLREEWVIVAAHRQERPWGGELVAPAGSPPPSFDPSCYLCPGNPRVSGRRNDPYTGVFVFDNDLPCVGAEAPQTPASPDGVPVAQPARGVVRVVCYTSRHDATLAELPLERVIELLTARQEQQRELATSFVVKTLEVELAAGGRYLAETGRVPFQDVLRAELDDGRRVIGEHGSALSFAPYFARFPYEAFVAPRRTVPDIAALSAELRAVPGEHYKAAS
jgi:UDPglucose--hexose-1-phosphate uridylyltransferase